MNLSELKSLVEIEKKKARLLLCEVSVEKVGDGLYVRSDAKWAGDFKRGGEFISGELLHGREGLDAFNPPDQVFESDPHQPRKVVVVRVERHPSFVDEREFVRQVDRRTGKTVTIRNLNYKPRFENIAFYSSSGASYDPYIEKFDNRGQLVKVPNPAYVPPGKWIAFGGMLYRGNNIENHRRGLNDPSLYVLKRPFKKFKHVNEYSALSKWLDAIDRGGAFGEPKTRLRTDQVNKTLNSVGALKKRWRSGGWTYSVFPGVEVTRDYYHVRGGGVELDPERIPGSTRAPGPVALSYEASSRGYTDADPVYTQPKERITPATIPEPQQFAGGQGRQSPRQNFRNAVNKIKNRRGYVVLPRTLTKGWKPVSKKSGADATIIGQRLQEMAPEMPATSTKRILDFWGTKAGTVGAVIDLGFFASEIHEIIDNKNLSQNQKEKLIRDKAKKHAIDASKDAAICTVLSTALTPAACAAYLSGPLVYYAGATALTVAKDALVGLGDFLSDVINIGFGANTAQLTAKFNLEDQPIDSESLEEEDYYDCMKRKKNGEKVYWNPKARKNPNTGKWQGECYCRLSGKPSYNEGECTDENYDAGPTDD